jgi:hypothetical protein
MPLFEIIYTGAAEKRETGSFREIIIVRVVRA